MKRVILIGMVAVFVAVASLPAVGVYAGFPGITGNNASSEFETSSHKQYQGKHPKKNKKNKKNKKGNKGKKKGCKKALAKAPPARAGKGCASVGGVVANPPNN